MKLKLKKLINYILVFGGLTLPSLVFAQSNGVTQGLQETGVGSQFGTTGISGSQNLVQLIQNVIEIMLLFAGGIAVIFVIIGGYQYITSGGNAEQAETGQKTLTNAVIGVVVIVLSYTIITVIANLVSSQSGYGF